MVREAREDTDRLRMWTEQQLSSSAQTHRHGSEVLRSLLQDKMVVCAYVCVCVGVFVSLSAGLW